MNHAPSINPVSGFPLKRRIASGGGAGAAKAAACPLLL
jgi:hypothetical protein